MARSTFVYVTYIRTTPARLWSALTDAAFMTQLVRHALRQSVVAWLSMEAGVARRRGARRMTSEAFAFQRQAYESSTRSKR